MQIQTSQKKNKTITLTKVKKTAATLVATSQEKVTDVRFPNISTDSPLSAEGGQVSTPAKQIGFQPLLKAENSRGTVLLLNGCQAEGRHTALIQHLYRTLVDKGWDTQVLQTSLGDDPVAAINASAQDIKKQTNKPITLLAHGCDEQSIMTYATQKGITSISAYIALSLTPKVTNGEQRTIFNAPLLDIRGGKSTSEKSSDHIFWMKAIEASGGKSMELLTADSYFLGQEDSLILFISNWLR